MLPEAHDGGPQVASEGLGPLEGLVWQGPLWVLGGLQGPVPWPQGQGGHEGSSLPS